MGFSVGHSFQEFKHDGLRRTCHRRNCEVWVQTRSAPVLLNFNMSFFEASAVGNQTDGLLSVPGERASWGRWWGGEVVISTLI